MSSPAVIAGASAALSAALAFWLVLRFPRLGPQTVAPAFACCAGSFALLSAVGPAFGWVRDAASPAVALLAVAVPIFAFAFWSGAVLARVTVAGPGRGLPVRARVRARTRGRRR